MVDKQGEYVFLWKSARSMISSLLRYQQSDSYYANSIDLQETPQSRARTDRMRQESWSMVSRFWVVVCGCILFAKATLCPDYERTSLKPYIDLFEKHVSAVMRDNREAKKVVQDSKVSLDF
jgi:hypothetical protein